MKTILYLLFLPLFGCASVQSIVWEGHANHKWVRIVERDGRLISTSDIKVHRTQSLFKPTKIDNGLILGSRVNPWIFGNIIYGGPPGVIVDVLTGAAFEPYPLQAIPAP